MGKKSKPSVIDIVRAKRSARGEQQHDDTGHDHRVYVPDGYMTHLRLINRWEEWIEFEGHSHDWSLSPSFQPPAVQHWKSFVRFLVDSKAAKTPSARAVKQDLSNLCSAITVATRWVMPDDMKKDIRAFVGEKLRREGEVTTATRPKLAFKADDLRYVQSVLWADADGPHLRSAVLVFSDWTDSIGTSFSRVMYLPEDSHRKIKVRPRPDFPKVALESWASSDVKIQNLSLIG